MLNINRVVMTGNLTRDPELRSLPSGLSVCNLRVACNTRRRGASGEWEDKPNYFDVAVWGPQGENCARYLKKGSPVAIDGRLEWREYNKDGEKRQAVDIIADSVQFLGQRDKDAAEQAGEGAAAEPDSKPRATRQAAQGKPRATRQAARGAGGKRQARKASASK